MLLRVVLALAGCLTFSVAAPLGGAATAEDRFFDSKGVRIRYIEQGQGEPVVLIHGFAANLELAWVANGIMENLAKDFRVIALDARGHGKSGKPHDPKQYGPEMAEDVVRLLDHLKIKKAHVVGYSMGGGNALKLLSTHPDRLLTATVAGAGCPSPGSRTADARSRQKVADVMDQSKDLGEVFARLAPPDQPKPPEEKLRFRKKLIAAPNDLKALAAWLRGANDSVESGDDLKGVKVPTLVLGSADPVKPSAEELKRHIPNCKTVVIDGGDHGSTFGRPEFVRSLKEFLKANARVK